MPVLISENLARKYVDKIKIMNLRWILTSEI
jgi:hypothetical protein